MSDVRQIVSRLEEGGGTLTLDGDRIRYSVPSGNPQVPSLLAELRRHREEVAELLRHRASWPPESFDAERRFAQPHAKLFPYLGRKVRTPSGSGTLLQVFADRATVLLDSELSRCSFFSPKQIEPVSWEPVDS
jgi:hypothetical protein